MSRKRAKKQHEKSAPAVPEEIMAEGSGPHLEGEAAATAPVMGEDGTLAVAAVQPAAAEDAIADAPAELDAAAGGDAAELAAGDAREYIVAIGTEQVEGDAGAELDADAEVEAAAESEDGEVGAALPTGAAAMDGTQLKHLVEALVFASDRPVTLQRLRQLTRVADVTRLEHALAELAADFADRGLILQQVSGGYQFRTQTRYSAWVQQLIAGRPVRLSRAQLETLAIVAYRQPITRPEIDEIRGVDSSGTLKVLLDRGLVRVLGKKEEVGRPMLYGTTKEFLDFFSLGDLRELPTLREYSELTPESKRVMTDKLGPAPDEASPAEAFAEGSGGMVIAEALAAVGEPFDAMAAEPDVLASADEPAELDVHAAEDAATGDAPLALVHERDDDGDDDDDDDDELADPAVLAEASAVARALAADHDDVDREMDARAETDELDAAPPLDPADDLLAEPNPQDEILD